MSALRAFLGESIDDAGLFPPAGLSLADALEANARAAGGDEFWMLGRFVVPAARTGELAGMLNDSPDPLACSAVVNGSDVFRHFAELARHEIEHGERFVVEAVETALSQSDAGGAARAVAELFAQLDAAGWRARPALFVELDPAQALDAAFAALRDERERRDVDACAKLRCGGATPGATPASESVARFIVAARDAGVPFKATAGLHHPFRHRDGSAGGFAHGFVNVIGAAVLASLGADEPTLHAVVADDDPSHFRLDANAFAWNGIVAGREAIGAARMQLFRSFGSCSFSEPVADLQASGILPRA